MARPERKKGRRWWPWLLAGAIGVLLAGGFAADRLLKAREHPGLSTFIRQWARNYPASFAVEPERISLKVGEHDLEELQRVVEEARARGVILPEGNSYVPAEISHGEQAFKAKLRIKGKLTDHVKGSKWSFRVVSKKDGGFLGMRRFSLQHPGTRNYLCDWLYHRLMQAEGVIALRYGFAQVTFNDEDLGIYAYEEHFGPELLEHNGRVDGPIFRFDPALFWEHRLNEMNKLRFDEPFAAYQAAAVDAFGSSDLEKDKEARHRFEQALALMDSFRRGEKKASEVFDADRIARHHAILDLVGGHHSMDWSDVKFYFDPVLKRVEPISYESFSAHPIRELAGSNRWTGGPTQGMDLHTQWFNDEEIFRAYVHHLERVSRTDWLDSAFTALKPALDSASAVLYREFPYKELDRAVYYRNQRIISKLLEPPKLFHAYLDDNGPDTVSVTAVPIEDLPMEVHALVLADGTRIAPVGRSIIPVRRPGKLGAPLELRFAVEGKVDRAGLKLSASVLGAAKQREVEVFPYALLQDLDKAMGLGPQVDPHTLPWIAFDDAARTITIRNGAWTLDRTITLPAGYTFIATAPLRLDLRNGAEIISHAALRWEGLEEAPIEVFSTDSSAHGVHVLAVGGTSRLTHVRFATLSRLAAEQDRSGDLSFHRADAVIEHCSFSGTGATLVDFGMAKLTMTDCAFSGGSDQLELHFADAKVTQCAFADAADDAVSAEGGVLRLEDNDVFGAGGIAVKATKSARIDATGLRIRSCKQAFEGREGSVVKVSGGAVKSIELVAELKKDEMRYGPVRLALEKVSIAEAKAEFVIGAGSEVKVDGKPVGAKKP
ncbi:MAG: CotH kinase family protein [Flavobacteriales bacterium]|nr:CotH kinase family protein [Flavobacteriales bacterium]